MFLVRFKDLMTRLLTGIQTMDVIVKDRCCSNTFLILLILSKALLPVVITTELSYKWAKIVLHGCQIIEVRSCNKLHLKSVNMIKDSEVLDCKL